MSSSHTVEIAAELLPYLIDRYPDVKRTKLRQWLKHGAVQVNGQAAVRTNHPLQPGDTVAIGGKSDPRAEFQFPLGMKVLYEDASLLVIEKPANLLSMASDSEREKTAYAVLTDYVRRGNRQSRDRVWIVHRLDRETSGLLVFARSAEAKRRLQAQWFEAEKHYLAVVEGNPPAEQGVFSSHLDESGPFKVYSAPPSERTRHAVTRYRVVKRNVVRTLIELIPETGRRNQLRVHLADAGCPIIGDLKYEARTDPARRLGLHACSLQFKHPVTDELLTFESPLPPDLARQV